jgi:periplasmic copper chaperone A
MLVGVRLTALLVAAGLWFSSSALAHVSVASPATAGQNPLLTFGVGHGCEGADTIRIEVTLPTEITTVRGVPSASWGDPELKADDTGIVRSVVWSKNTSRAKDELYYQLQLRVGVPDAPFTTLYFPAKQTCKDAEGKESVVNWDALPDPSAEPSEDGPPPAPALTVLPARKAGWNKFSVKTALTDLTIFDDAQIVWAGEAAYSSNPTTVELIEAEEDVEPLTEIKANTEIWVKY